jgi:hypothetical protein
MELTRKTPLSQPSRSAKDLLQTASAKKIVTVVTVVASTSIRQLSWSWCRKSPLYPLERDVHSVVLGDAVTNSNALMQAKGSSANLQLRDSAALVKGV